MKIKNKIKKITSWTDQNLLRLFCGFLLIFIPLYPKIPLAELIPGYIVRMRLEDIFVLVAAGIWAIQVIRKKVKYHSITHVMIISYLVVGFLSLLSAATVTQTIPWQPLHLGKSFLHWFRYIEYFTLFFITFSSIESIKHVKTLIKIMMVTLILVVFYGYGQKYHYWPVFSTMNREFSKGIRLYLTEHARVQSTFGGHYDFAGYLVIVLNLVFGLALTCKKKLLKVSLHLIHLLGLWMLILTASRVSFIAYYFGIITILFVLSLIQDKAIRKLNFFLSKTILFTLLIGIMMISFGQDMRDRLFHVVKDYPQIEYTYNLVEEFVTDGSEAVLVFVGIKGSKPSGDWIAVNSSDQSEAERLAAEIDSVLDKTDQRPTSDKPRPDDVYVDVPDRVRVATESASGDTQYIMVDKERTWSDNALKYGLSAAIRLDTLWPNAIKGLKRNPLLGTGYATLNKESAFHFTEAESTDNNFLRVLGETGLLGFISFFTIVLSNFYFAYLLFKTENSAKENRDSGLILGFAAGYIGITIGLLINAVYIDVFASSKVAFTYWAVSGIMIALCYQPRFYSTIKKQKIIVLYKKVKKNLLRRKK